MAVTTGAMTARGLGIFGGAPTAASGRAAPLPTLIIDDMTVRSSIVPTRVPSFDSDHPGHRREVLVRVRGFSCNFRDKGFIQRLQQVPGERFFVIGSELVGVVEAVGSEVEGLSPGDRVLTDHHFTLRGLDDQGRNAAGVREGVATNSASREYQVYHEGKLLRVPDEMPDEVAAGFSLAAQTAYSMIRKTSPSRGARVLVTAATSNTSLVLISALHAQGAEVCVTTTSRTFDDRLRALGASHVVHIGEEDGGLRGNRELTALAVEVGGFECAYDPFFDLHMDTAIALLAPFGRYVSCGFVAQNPGAARKANLEPIDAQELMKGVLLKNVTIHGNCLGLREDLIRALDDYQANRLACHVDSTFDGVDTAGFLHRTFNDRSRFGKVVFRYSDS